MSITVYPVKMEGYDDLHEPLFSIEAMDDTCAMVKIDSAVSPAYWPEVSDAILAALKQMFPEEQA